MEPAMTSTQHDRYHLPLSTNSSVAAERYVQGIDLVLSGNVGAEERLEDALQSDEGFALAHAALASLDLRWRRFESAIAHAEAARTLASGTSRREQQHVAVITSMIDGRGAEALRLATEHLDIFPSDAYILQQYIGMRRGVGCLELNAAILDKIEALEPAYGDDWFYAGTRSFQLHELNRFDESRRYAELSLSGNPRNGNAAHNMAHCFYETADYVAGIDFLRDWIVGYHPDAPHYSHLNWHKALFDLTQGRYQDSYDVYRETIRPSVLMQDIGGLGPPLADATSLFWRYRLYGSPLEQAADWTEVDQFAVVTAAGPRSPFYDAHCALSFAATGNDRAMNALIDAMRTAADGGHAVTREVALPLVLGIEAFGRGAYAETIAQIEPIFDDLVRIGGSQAQRMVFEETLLRAYMLAERPEKAEGLLRKRLEHRHSGRDFFWLAEADSSQGLVDAASEHRRRARGLWTDADPNAPEFAANGS
jgi:tetratricopeptide (TPR) repeat protein